MLLRVLQKNFSGNENCTLVATYNIMRYYRSKGYSKIPSNNTTLYNKIMTQAKNLGYNPNNKSGLSVTKNNNLITNTWKKGFGYSSGSGSNNYFWTNSSIRSSISNGKPFIFSMASKPYYNHSIVVYGYKVYKNNRTGKQYEFLIVSDGWSSTTRYLAPENYVGCMTSVTPPSSKTR